MTILNRLCLTPLIEVDNAFSDSVQLTLFGPDSVVLETNRMVGLTQSFLLVDRAEKC